MVTKVQSKETLLAELASVFLSRGYEGATFTELARATGLGKASLYHHFPGGKEEMVAVLLRDAVAKLEAMAFSRLGEKRPPGERLRRFVDGFEKYVEGGEQHCLVAIVAQGSLGKRHGEQIAEQFRSWQQQLAAVYEETGQKTKRANRSAQGLLAVLYGYLLTAKLLQQPDHFRQGIKRLKKLLPGSA
jgi:TetR/AcrR family transcriptional regulator, lmrAB and yxaGH operons repressor